MTELTAQPRYSILRSAFPVEHDGNPRMRMLTTQQPFKTIVTEFSFLAQTIQLKLYPL